MKLSLGIHKSVVNLWAWVNGAASLCFVVVNGDIYDAHFLCIAGRSGVSTVVSKRSRPYSSGAGKTRNCSRSYLTCEGDTYEC